MLTIPENIKKGQGALAPSQLKDFSEDYGQAIENSFDLDVNFYARFLPLCNIGRANSSNIGLATGIKTMVFQPFHDEIKITVVKQVACVFQRRLLLFER